MTYFVDLSTDVLAVLIVLGTLVFIHELGHYLAAKAFGVRVDVFSLGFGKRLFGSKRGDTDYRISALPLGGYVKMAGENPLEQATGDPAEFSAKPRWQRLIIAAAGPAVNIGFAIAVITGIFMIENFGPAYLKLPAAIAEVAPASRAAGLGLVPNDQVIAVDGKRTDTWEKALDGIAYDAGRTVHLTLLRDGQLVSKEFSFDQYDADPFEFLGIEPSQPYVIGAPSKGLPADTAGLRAGDVILTVNGAGIHSTDGLSRILQQSKDKPVAVEVRRNVKVLSFVISPVLDTESGDTRYRIGVREAPSPGLPFVEAFRASLAFNRDNSFRIFEVLKRLVETKVSIKEMSGPIGIARQSGEALRVGPLFFLVMMAIISLNLGIFNLLPIPILDGGLILMILIEGIMRRDIKREVKELVYQTAFVFIVIFAVVVIYNDIAKTPFGHTMHLP